MKNILIVGSTGKIGEYLTETLSKKYNVITLSRKKANEKNFNYDFKKDEGNIAEIKNYKIDVVINALGILPTNNAELETFYKINADAIIVLRQFLNENTTFVQMSTVAVYGENIYGRPIVEEDPVKPKNNYAKSKLQGEFNVKSLFPKHYIFRIPPVFIDFKDATLFKRIVKNRFLEIKFGNDTQKHSFCSLDTIENTVIASIEGQLKHGLYHLAEDRLFDSNFLKGCVSTKSFLKLIIPKAFINLLLWVFKKIPVSILNNKINEINFKVFSDNIFDTTKLNNNLNKNNV